MIAMLKSLGWLIVLLVVMIDALTAYAATTMDGMVGGDVADGLRSLKQLAEER
jgi:hypothetical protein